MSALVPAVSVLLRDKAVLPRALPSVEEPKLRAKIQGSAPRGIDHSGKCIGTNTLACRPEALVVENDMLYCLLCVGSAERPQSADSSRAVSRE